MGINLARRKTITPELCLEAVQQDGLQLEHVPNEWRTHELCLAAVRQRGEALRFVDRQTRDICLAGVRKDGCALVYIKRQTAEICVTAMQSQLGVITWQFVKRRYRRLFAEDPAVVLEAVEKLGCEIPANRFDVLALRAERDMERIVRKSTIAKQRAQRGITEPALPKRERDFGL